jgi:hypothetical protein
MKNIHILPTTQPTGIFETNSGLQFSIMNKVRYGEFKGFHIYITSDEELPYDNSIFATGAFYHRDAAKDIHIITKDTFHPNPNFCSRIILTTDDSLFKYGVQSIDDEFLEWFVKNPSCESIEVEEKTPDEIEKELGIYGHDIGLTENEYSEWLKNGGQLYKIIIPQEEPKQETLEEAAEKYTIDSPQMSEIRKIAFIKGAKWQGERMYAEADNIMRFLDTEVELKLSDTKTIERIKWYFETYFEQFKKK